MKELEAQLLDYIDGLSSIEERKTIELILASDASAFALYEELLAFNAELTEGIDLDEPSMSFSRGVMDKIKLTQAPVALKTKVNQLLVKSIGVFFAALFGGVVIYSFLKADYANSYTFYSVDILEDFSFSNVGIYGFLILDAVLLLICLDRFIRREIARGIKKGELQ